MRAKNFLFVGGQHHGKMLPICETSIRLAASAVVDCLRPQPGHGTYQGYRLARINSGGGGQRLVAIAANAGRHAALDKIVIDAQFAALENYERALHAAFHPKKESERARGRRIPLNESLPDEPGRPARRTKTNVDYDPAANSGLVS